MSRSMSSVVAATWLASLAAISSGCPVDTLAAGWLNEESWWQLSIRGLDRLPARGPLATSR